MVLKPTSSPGWTLGTLASLTLVYLLGNMYSPSAFMAEYEIQSEEVARLISFVLILVNIYDISGALQDNYFVYYFSLLSRAAACALFASFGPLWQNMAIMEATTFVILGVGILWGR